MLNEHEDEHILKIILLGDPNSGKTSLLIRLTKDSLEDKNYISTIGVEYVSFIN